MDLFDTLTANPQQYLLITVFVFIFGCCVGSFLNVVIWRVPLGESIVTAPSHCPKCQSNIPWYLNIPILAWLALRGKCRNCKAPISARYPIVEFITGVLFLLIWWRGFELATWQIGSWSTAQLVLHFYIVSMLIAVTYIDFDHMEIPDGINLTTLIVGVGLAIAVPSAFGFAGAPDHIDNVRHKGPILHSFGSLIVLQWEGMLSFARPWSLLDSFLGIIFGGGFLWLLAELGKKLMGAKRHTTDEPLIMRITPEGFHTDVDGDIRWEDVLTREEDMLTVAGEITAIQWKHGSKTLQFQPAFELNQITEIQANDEFVTFGGHDVVHMSHIKELHLRTSEWIEPREAFGYGDVKLLGALGACLGPGAVVFILIVSSVLGAVGGVSMALLGNTRLYRPIPFGPYIAAAAILYLLQGPEIAMLYYRLVVAPIFGAGDGMDDVPLPDM